MPLNTTADGRSAVGAKTVVSTFVVNDTAPTELYTLSLHDALPICVLVVAPPQTRIGRAEVPGSHVRSIHPQAGASELSEADRKSTRLNSSHVEISYAVFCLKKKKPNSWI